MDITLVRTGAGNVFELPGHLHGQEGTLGQEKRGSQRRVVWFIVWSSLTGSSMKTSTVGTLVSAQKWLVNTVAYLEFPATGEKVTLGAPSQPVRGNINAKSDLGVMGRGKLTRAPHTIVSRPAWNFNMAVKSQSLRYELSILKIKIYRKVKNLS